MDLAQQYAMLQTPLIPMGIGNVKNRKENTPHSANNKKNKNSDGIRTIYKPNETNAKVAEQNAIADPRHNNILDIESDKLSYNTALWIRPLLVPITLTLGVKQMIVIHAYPFEKLDNMKVMIFSPS